MTILEIAVQDAAGARAAFANGADRVELCQALGATGGLTASAGMVDAVLEVAGRADRVAALVRPRAGGFVYDAEEVAVVTADIRDVVRRGVGSVVVGALTADGMLDADAMTRWRDAAEDADVVLHRAIDTLPEPERIVDELAGLGVRRVLTSGGAARSIDAVATLGRLVQRAAGRVEIMAGGGVRVQDIPAIIAMGVDAVHLSARMPSDDAAPSGPGGGAVGHEITDAATVAAAAAQLRGV